MLAARKTVHCAATCISGEVGNHTPAPASARARIVVFVGVVGAPHAGDEHVALAPEHRLGPTGGAAGARDVDVVG